MGYKSKRWLRVWIMDSEILGDIYLLENSIKGDILCFETGLKQSKLLTVLSKL